jgi:hypothetical protein
MGCGRYRDNGDVLGVNDNGLFGNNIFGGFPCLCGRRNHVPEVIEDETIVLGISDELGDEACYKCKRVRDEVCRRRNVLGVEDRRCNGDVLGVEDRRRGCKRRHRH